MHTTDSETYNRALGACLATLAGGVWSDDGVDLTEDAQARLSATLQGVSTAVRRKAWGDALDHARRHWERWGTPPRAW